MTDSTTQARELLEAAAAADQSGAAVARQGSRAIAAVEISIGVLVALFLLAAVYIFPSDNIVAVILSIVGYTVGIIVTVFVYNRFRVAAGYGATRRYMIGLSLSMGLFALGVASTFLVTITTPLVWAPFAIIVAAPLVDTGVLEARR